MNDNVEKIKPYLMDYVQEITEQSSQRGKNQYICPLCKSGTGSHHTGAFTVYPDTNTYYCFACNENGNIFNLYSKINHINDFKVVLRELERKYNIFSPQSKYKDYTKFFFIAEQHLHETNYLTKRGLSIKTQRQFNCGYIENFAYKENQSTSAVIIPTSPSSFMWRSTVDNIKQKRGSAHILNPTALKQQYCFIVEGEIDCMSVIECGYHCIGLGSASNIKKIFSYNTSAVLILALDNDKRGAIATTSLAKECDEHRIPYIIAPNDIWGNCKDANELLISDKQTLINNLQMLSERALTLDKNLWLANMLERKQADSDWRSGLKRNSTDNAVKNTLKNLFFILNNDTTYKNKIEFNELTQMRTMNRSNWNDVIESRLKLYLEQEYDLFTSIESINHICNIIADEHSYHPIREYLNSVQWDGIHRLSTVFSDFLGATNNIYTQSVAIITFVGAVARIFEPGVKFDTCTTLVGKQGTGKSMFLNKIAVKAEWFTDGVTSFDGKEFYESIQGKWIVELGEGTAFQKSIKERSKQAIASQQDFYRKPYGRNPEIRKRQCVFLGTTNNYDFLKDETGDRRYYPIDVTIQKATKSIFNDLTADYVAQLWAEAVQLYKSGQSIYIQDRQVLALAEQEQRKHFDESPLQADIHNFLEILLPSAQEWSNMDLESRRRYIRAVQNGEDTARTIGKVGAYKRDRISVKEIVCELFEYDLNQAIERKFSLEISRTLTALGWIKKGKKERLNLYSTQWIYFI